MSGAFKLYDTRGIRQAIAVGLALTAAGLTEGQTVPPVLKDPGVRTAGIDAGKPFSTLTSAELQFFNDGMTRFKTAETVSTGLGPTFNSVSCVSCHSQPAPGGTSPNANNFPNIGPNPQSQLGTSSNPPPSFVNANGPVLEARFPFFLNANGQTLSSVPDGSVHDLFVITGMSGVSSSCNISQPNFGLMTQLNNIIFRIPTPLFGLGLLETITDETIIANMNANASTKASLGILGVPNRSGNDGTITRFGWKAQNKSGQVFAGEAYNVEMGITNEQFPNERGNSSIQNASNDPPTACLLNALPEDATNFTQSGTQIPSDIVEFSHFMRFLQPPAQDPNNISGNPTAAQIAQGKATFEALGCNMCHTESLPTGSSSYDTGTNQTTAFLSNQTANLYSDLLIHHMGGLADGITQGLAAGDEFRTAPLWGLGQRIFLLHDGRAGYNAGGLVEAILDHDLPPPSGSNYPTSEAHGVITNFNNYYNGTAAQHTDLQDMLYFLRSL